MLKPCRHGKRWWRLSADRRYVVCDACFKRVPGAVVVWVGSELAASSVPENKEGQA